MRVYVKRVEGRGTTTTRWLIDPTQTLAASPFFFFKHTDRCVASSTALEELAATLSAEKKAAASSMVLVCALVGLGVCRARRLL